ncbi:MAG: hypothetical protein K8T26_08910 [Lentisphaerae bacterium]|nr:hypothetical protein [Lentisphaerota bacterium]
MTGKTPPRRLTRAESFVGVHYDFHAGPDCTAIGARTTRRMLNRIIDAVQPDYLQTDCKGHRGMSSYPTKVGHPAPGFVGDPLKLWREVTAARGVALFMHYSGVWDDEALKHHPSWSCVGANGKRDKRKTSVFGPYVDKLLIPQLKELCDVYGVDGVWIDGDCWATVPDYRPDVLAAFRRDTGIRAIPRRPKDPHHAAFLAYCREGFRRYVRHYVDTLRRHNPAFQVTSNWAFSSFMPEPVTANLPFLSGDYSCFDSINTARFEGRWLAQQGRPWDLMAWSFNGEMDNGDWSTKSIPQLQREAATVIALGGGFQAYFSQRRDGSVREWQLPLMAAAAAFCRARQSICQGGKLIPQIGLLYSRAAYYREQPGVFAWPDKYLNGLRGVLQALLDGQQVVDIVGEHHLAGRMKDYPVIIVPEWAHLDPAFRRELRDYVRNGGNLLLIGPRAAALFTRELGVRAKSAPADKKVWLAHQDGLAALLTLSQDVAPRPGTQTFGTLHPENDPESPAMPAATIRRYGRGQIAAVYANLGARYRTSTSPTVRDFLAALTRRLFPTPLVDVTGSHTVDVSAMHVRGQCVIHLVNTAGPHADRSVCIHDDIPPVGPLAVTLRLPRRPRAIRLAPDGGRLRFTWSKGAAHLTVKRLALHAALVVEA